MKLSIVLSTHDTSFSALAFSGEFARNVQRISSLGYDGVELAVRDPKLVDPGLIAEVVAAAGLEVPAIGTGQAYVEEGLSFAHPDAEIRRLAVARINDQARLAARLDQAMVIIGLIRGKSSDGGGETGARRRVRQCLAECGEEAARLGVRLVVEPINRYETDLYNTVDETLELLDMAGMDNIGVLFDTFHANIEEFRFAASIARTGRRLVHVHVADSNRWAPGDGHLDFSIIVEDLRRSGYRGYLSAEILPQPDPETCAARAYTHMRSFVPKET